MDILNAIPVQTADKPDGIPFIASPPAVKPAKASPKGGLVALTAVFLAGVLCGTLLWMYYPAASGSSALTDILSEYSIIHSSGSLRSIFLSTFSGTAAMIILCFFCGTSYLSLPLLALVPFFKGAGYGLSFAYLYSQSGGVKTVLLCLLLPAVLSAFAVVIASLEGIRMSRSVFNAMYGYPDIKEINFGVYIAKFLLSAAIAAAAAGADALTAGMFSYAINI